MQEEAVEARHGDKMITMYIRFWTDNIAEEKGKIHPKHAWTSGVVGFNKNESHGIESTQRQITFNSPMDLLSAIEKLFIENGIQLHLSNKMRQYYFNE